MVSIGMNLCLFSKISSPGFQKMTFSSSATGRLSDGTAVSVSRVGFSSGSAWLQTVIFETDTASGEVAGGVRGRGRPDDHPLPVSRTARMAGRGAWRPCPRQPACVCAKESLLGTSVDIKPMFLSGNSINNY